MKFYNFLIIEQVFVISEFFFIFNYSIDKRTHIYKVAISYKHTHTHTHTHILTHTLTTHTHTHIYIYISFEREWNASHKIYTPTYIKLQFLTSTHTYTHTHTHTHIYIYIYIYIYIIWEGLKWIRQNIYVKRWSDERYIFGVVNDMFLLFIHFLSAHAFRLQICPHGSLFHNAIWHNYSKTIFWYEISPSLIKMMLKDFNIHL